MEELFNDIVAQLHAAGTLDERVLRRILAEHNRRVHGTHRTYAKKHLYPYFLKVRTEDPDQWQRWNLSPAETDLLTTAVRMKPRRTQSGVATITVITKPWPCSGTCRYCPNDIRMPKSYLANEPACQRAERNHFDPYLQVASRLTTLRQMGHATDKVEIIILGGTFAEYPRGYQQWFARELFRAANDAGTSTGCETALTHSSDTVAPLDFDTSAESDSLVKEVAKRRAFYHDLGIANNAETLKTNSAAIQQRINDGNTTYNAAFPELYGTQTPWQQAGMAQTATLKEVEAEQVINETSAHRIVGLVIETRPDTVSAESLALFRRLGCTKVQIGVQSVSQDLLDINKRHMKLTQIQRAFDLLRAFGFKTHAHFMVNLMGTTPERDRREFIHFVSDAHWQPDEIKLYPVALIGGTQLERDWQAGLWKPYDEETLVDVLAKDVIATPPYTRISRMIRDFSSGDIVAGNKKTNLRQLVENNVAETGTAVHEIRYREIGKEGCDPRELTLDVISYETTNTSERFLQWVTPKGKIAGFLRLSLPHQDYVHAHAFELPIHPKEAMIREVHIYGSVARISQNKGIPAQHHGLGKRLIEQACNIARKAGYTRINVISAVGTRNYYRARGFADHGLYQQRTL